MKIDDTSFDTLRKLIEGQRLAVLATQMQERPYTSLVAFVASKDLRRLFFVTSRATTKYRNLSENSHVSLLIDSRTHSVEDFATGAAATAIGTAAELSEEDAESTIARFLKHHPYLEDFVKAPSTAICAVEVETYYLVTRFQHVVELDLTS